MALPAETLPARRVLKAYEQIYEQLRELILAGRLARGQRLPTEVALAGRFGVSRGTIREALRLLVADGLVHTAKGTGGGSFVTLPTVDHVSEFLKRNLELLSLADDVTLAEFIQARELLELFAVRAAALRRTPADLARLRATFASEDEGLSPFEMYLQNKEFHATLLDIADNALLKIAAQPIFFVLHTHLARSRLGASFPRRVCSEHEGIYAHIEAGDADAAEAAMRCHLEYLGDVYERIWRADGLE